MLDMCNAGGIGHDWLYKYSTTAAVSLWDMLVNGNITWNRNDRSSFELGFRMTDTLIS